MAFQIKDFVSIVASMLNHGRGTTKKITDWQPGSVARTLVEAPAVEIEELYHQYFYGLREAIPVATFKSFGFGKRAAQFARGFATITNNHPSSVGWTMPAGTSFTSDDGRVWNSISAFSWPSVDTKSIRVAVRAEKTGIAYNVSTGGITSCSALGSEYVISNSAITTGADAETETEQEARFAEFIGSLSRGTTFAMVNAAAGAALLDAEGNQVEYVTRVGFDEIAGYVKIYIYSSAGVPSAELITKAQTIIDGSKDPDTGKRTPGFRAGGVRCDVIAMTERAADVSATVTMFTGYTLTTATVQSIQDSLETLLENVQAGEILYADQVETAILSVTGVKSVILHMDENITCGNNEALVLGQFKVNPV